MEELDVKSKYYAPSIEEFRIGFIYEFKHPDYDSSGWKLYLTPEFNSEFEDCIFVNDMKCFRVKYLDSEDIESLGFKKEDGESYYVFTKYKLGGNDFLIEFRDGNIKIIYNVYMRLPKCLFDGRIKNKSELIQILKMVGIL